MHFQISLILQVWRFQKANLTLIVCVYVCVRADTHTLLLLWAYFKVNPPVTFKCTNIFYP